jgi:hypothetical protein
MVSANRKFDIFSKMVLPPRVHLNFRRLPPLYRTLPHIPTSDHMVNGPEENLWELEVNLEHCQDLVDKFNKKFPEGGFKTQEVREQYFSNWVFGCFPGTECRAKRGGFF